MRNAVSKFFLFLVCLSISVFKFVKALVVFLQLNLFLGKKRWRYWYEYTSYFWLLHATDVSTCKSILCLMAPSSSIFLLDLKFEIKCLEVSKIANIVQLSCKKNSNTAWNTTENSSIFGLQNRTAQVWQQSSSRSIVRRIMTINTMIGQCCATDTASSEVFV